MKKQEVIKEIAKKTELTQVQVRAVIDAMYEVVIENFNTDDEGIPVFKGLKIVGADMAARDRYNIQTGETIHVPAKRIVKAKVGAELKKLNTVIE